MSTEDAPIAMDSTSLDERQRARLGARAGSDGRGRGARRPVRIARPMTGLLGIARPMTGLLPTAVLFATVLAAASPGSALAPPASGPTDSSERRGTAGLQAPGTVRSQARGAAGPQAHGESDALGSYVSAREILERGVESMGGRETLVRVGGIVWEASGTIDKTAERQGRAPEVPSAGSYRESLAVDPAAERVAWEYREDRYDGTWEWIREIYEGDDVFRVLVLQEGIAVEQRGGRIATERERIERRTPGLLLEQLLATPEALRHGGVDPHGRVTVTGALPGGELVTVGIDQDSGALRQLEYVADLETLGDALVTWEWNDYRQVPGLGLFPGSRRTTIAGRTFVDVTVQAVSTGASAVGELFETPADLQGPLVQELDDEDPGPDEAGAGEGGRIDASAGARLETVAPGVHRVRALRGGFHPLFVEFEDFVVAVDAPAGFPLMNQIPATDVAPGPSSAWLSERYLELIRRQVPDKPVRHVVLTHFHNDHAGGVRAFVAEGATVLATGSAAPAVRELVEETPHTLAPDRLTRSSRPLKVEVVRDGRAIDDGERVMEVIDVGPNPHTEQMLVVNLPDAGIMFVSDLLDPTRVDSFPKPAHAALDRWFAGWLERNGLAPERIYTMHGTGLVTPEHLAQLEASVAVAGDVADAVEAADAVETGDAVETADAVEAGDPDDAGPTAASGDGGGVAAESGIRIVVPDHPVEAGGPALPLVEPRPAVDPDDPDHLVVAAIVAAPEREGPWHCAALTSFDGGTSWTRSELAVDRCIDPWVVFTGVGPLVTAIEIGRGEDRGFELFGFGSPDGGRTWTGSPAVYGDSFDHEILAVAPDGRVFMTARRNRASATGRPRHTVWVGRSDDSGRSFQELAELEPSTLALNPTGIAVAGASIVVAFRDSQRDVDGFRGEGMLARARAWAVRSDDSGRTFSPPMLITDECASGIEGAFPGYPFLAGDPDGRLYHVCVRPGLDGIALTRSTDGGTRWSDPLRVDGGPEDSHVRTPMLAVNATGVAGVAWFDRRDDPECQRLYFTASTDGGETALEPVVVSTEPSCPARGDNGRVARSWSMGGDYSSLVAGPDGRFHLVWADSRSGRFRLRHAALEVGRPERGASSGESGTTGMLSGDRVEAGKATPAGGS